MTGSWSYQIRIYLSEQVSNLARGDPGNPLLDPLNTVLRRHDAALACQFDAFAAYVAEAERDGTDGYPLYRWTKATIDEPDKAARHKLAFAVRIADQEIYPSTTADALDADLQPLIDGKTITRLTKQDTNPANNIPIPPAYR